MTDPATAVLAATLAAAAMLVGGRPVLAALPEPAPGDQGPGGKVPYVALATRTFVLICAAMSGVAVGLSWLLVPAAARPLWTVLGTVGILLAAVDARTTWLPLPLTRAAWLLMGAAGLLAGGVAGVGDGPGAALRTLLGAALGAAVAGGLYLVVWLVTRGGFGFGDVRFAPLVGAATAVPTFTMLLWALFLGSLVGGVVGIIRLVQRRPGPFPYAPAMVAGAYLALLVGPVLGFSG